MSDTKLVICEKCCGTGRVNGRDENSSWSKTCEDCHGIGFSRVPMSNADRIRGMPDEELAELIVKHEPLYSWPKAVREIWMQPNVTKIQAWVMWLQQPEGGE